MDQKGPQAPQLDPNRHWSRNPGLDAREEAPELEYRLPEDCYSQYFLPIEGKLELGHRSNGIGRVGSYKGGAAISSNSEINVISCLDLLPKSQECLRGKTRKSWDRSPEQLR